MTAPCIRDGIRRAYLIRRDADGQQIDMLEVTGPNAGEKGTQSGVEMADRELKEMWHAKRTREEVQLLGVPGARPAPDVVEVRRWVMRLVTYATDNALWEETERRLWHLTSPDTLDGGTGHFVVRYVEKNGEAREITVKRTGTPEPESDTYPGERGWEAWTFEVTAYDPWWYGEDSYARATVGAGVSELTLTIRNRGDQLGHLLFTFPAANGQAQWTVPDGEGLYPAGHEKEGQRIMHTLPAIPAGKHAEASQRPDRLPFRIIGLPMSFGMMKQARLTNPIRPHLNREVELPIRVTSSATDAAIEVRLRPAYDRPHS